jgi:NitT/TauT family transport system permease protein
VFQQGATRDTSQSEADDLEIAIADDLEDARIEAWEKEATRRPRIRSRGGLGLLAPVLLGLFLVALWDAVTRWGVVSTFFLPTPYSIAKELVSQLRDGFLLDYVARTVTESIAGSALGLAVALPLAYLIARNRVAAAALQPYVAASQAVPAVALAPLLALWFGYGLLPIAVLCALLVFFPILVSTVLGLRQIDPDIMNAARVDGVSRAQMLRYIEWPLALPGTLAGIRAGLTLSITGAVVGEFVVGGDGLGQLLTVQRSEADTVGLFATLLVLTLLAACLYGLMLLLERWARW